MYVSGVGGSQSPTLLAHKMNFESLLISQITMGAQPTLNIVGLGIRSEN